MSDLVDVAEHAERAGWTLSYTGRGALRCRHANGSVIFISASATAEEIVSRLAEIEDTVARLQRRRLRT